MGIYLSLLFHTKENIGTFFVGLPITLLRGAGGEHLTDE
jgi:hypothetical protein